VTLFDLSFAPNYAYCHAWCFNRMVNFFYQFWSHF